MEKLTSWLVWRIEDPDKQTWRVAERGEIVKVDSFWFFNMDSPD